MNKKQLTELLARQSHRSRGQAADDVDKLVYSLLKDLRSAETKNLKQSIPAAVKAPVRPKGPEETSAQTEKAEKKKS